MAIAPMTRVFVVGPSDRKEEALRFLQEIGLLHVEPVAKMTPEDEKNNAAVLAALRKIDLVSQALGRYRGAAGKDAVAPPAENLVDQAEGALSALQETQTRKHSLQRLVAELAPWGDFDLRQIRELEAHGVYVRRYRMDARKWETFRMPEHIYAEVVGQAQGILFFAVTTDAPADIPQATALPWPERGLREAEQELEKLLAAEKALAATLSALAERMDDLKQRHAEALTEARYTETLATLYTEPYLFGLQGWVPAEREASFLEKAAKAPIPLRVETRPPLADETPPVLLKNSWFVQRIEPLLRLYGLPNYKEVDPSFFFAPFMIAFFGMCLGDAGYGIVMYAASHLIQKKLGPRVEGLPLVMRLCKAFAVAAFLVGILTGSVFGYNFENRSWILLDVSVGPGDPMRFFYLALGVGVLHLSFSYVLGMMQAAARHEALQKLGLLGVLWGGVLLVARNVWVSDPGNVLHMLLYYAGVGGLAVGLLLTLLFASNHRNWGVRLGLGLWNVYGLTGLIGDLLSYARLFGLGIATSAIASVMNQLANMVLQAMGAPGIVFAVFIAIFGHTFNLLLSILGSTVHSARLHFVEAFKSFFQGGGVAYRPFRIERRS